MGSVEPKGHTLAGTSEAEHLAARELAAGFLTDTLDQLALSVAEFEAQPFDESLHATGFIPGRVFADLSESLQDESVVGLARLVPCAWQHVRNARAIVEGAPSNVDSLHRVTEEVSTALGIVLSEHAPACKQCRAGGICGAV